MLKSLCFVVLIEFLGIDKNGTVHMDSCKPISHMRGDCGQNVGNHTVDTHHPGDLGQILYRWEIVNAFQVLELIHLSWVLQAVLRIKFRTLIDRVVTRLRVTNKSLITFTEKRLGSEIHLKQLSMVKISSNVHENNSFPQRSSRPKWRTFEGVSPSTG